MRCRKQRRETPVPARRLSNQWPQVLQGEGMVGVKRLAQLTGKQAFHFLPDQRHARCGSSWAPPAPGCRHRSPAAADRQSSRINGHIALELDVNHRCCDIKAKQAHRACTPSAVFALRVLRLGKIRPQSIQSGRKVWGVLEFHHAIAQRRPARQGLNQLSRWAMATQAPTKAP